MRRLRTGIIGDLCASTKLLVSRSGLVESCDSNAPFLFAVVMEVKYVDNAPRDQT